MQIRPAKLEAKAYTLGDGLGLGLLIESNGNKSWRFRYRFVGNPEMISPGFTRRSHLQMLALVVMKLGSWSRKERTLVRFEKRKLALQTESENAFEYIAREWHQMKSTKWSAGYASDIMEAFQSDIYLMWVRASRINQTARTTERAAQNRKPRLLENAQRTTTLLGSFSLCHYYGQQILILLQISPVHPKHINPITSHS